jgi:NADH-quinone oxidoreductase subunit D
LAVEKLCNIAVPDRCQWYRMALGEIARISDHLTCTGAMAMELGAFTPFLWFIKARDMLWDVLEEETGARMTHSFGRIGGMAKPPTKAFKELIRTALPKVIGLMDEGEKMLLENRIFIDRLENVGSISAADAIGLSWTGPCLRATGVSYDVRKAHPYLKYDEVEFNVPVGTKGDTLDRFLVRLAECRESYKILQQVCDKMADEGPVNTDDPRVMLPEKSEVYNTIEGTIQHFKIIMEGAKVPAGEVYSYTEAGNGELGFYLISDGTGTPYRVRIRPPCFSITGGLGKLITNGMLSDIVPIFGSLNMIGGECDH